MRLLIVMPSWVGDAVMATPSLRVLRELLPGAFIGGLVRPGIESVIAGTSFFDEVHIGRALGVMGPKRLAGKARPRRYDTALLLTNSFSTALVTRLAGIPRRIGYDRDGRHILLTDHIEAPRRRDTEPYKRSDTNPGAWAPIPACDYYFALAAHLLATAGLDAGDMGPLELVATPEDELGAAELLQRAGIPMERQRATPLALLNPGGNDDAKRWPPDRYAALADYLAEHRGMTVLLNGSPNETALVQDIADRCAHATPINLPEHGITLGTLKGVMKRCRFLVTNDTGPRHIAAAFGIPVVTLFGPTDHRWTTIPFADEIRLLADPSLPAEEVANDHPDRCRIDRIGLGDVVSAVNSLLTGVATP
jgi:heptosyltransferase-2